jgi:hypothetical protein
MAWKCRSHLEALLLLRSTLMLELLCSKYKIAWTAWFRSDA